MEPWWAFSSNFIYTIWNYAGLHSCNLDFLITSTLEQLMHALQVSYAELTSTPNFINPFLSHPTLNVSRITTETCTVCWKPPRLSFFMLLPLLTCVTSLAAPPVSSGQQCLYLGLIRTRTYKLMEFPTHAGQRCFGSICTKPSISMDITFL